MNKNLDAHSRAIANNIIQQLGDLRSQGLTKEEILYAIGLANEPIRLNLTHIGLESEDGSIRIHLAPLERALYKLFQNHPEGIIPTEIWQFYSEILEYYTCESIEEHDKIEETIDNLCESKEALTPIISRIKRKITETLGPVDSEAIIIWRFRDGRYQIGKK